MTEPKDRLQAARLNAGFKSPSEAARVIKTINQNTLISHENGNRALSRKAAVAYGEAFNVEPGWLLYGESNQDPVIEDKELARLISQASQETKDAIRVLLRAQSSEAKER